MKRAITAFVAAGALLLGGVATANSAAAASGYQTCSFGAKTKVAAYATGSGTLSVEVAGVKKRGTSSRAVTLTGFSNSSATLWIASATNQVSAGAYCY